MGFLCYAEKEKEGTFRMAHVEKYTAAAVGHMLDHYGRSPDDGVKRSNENIDPERTHLNYNLAPDHEGGQVAFLKNRLAQVKVQKRADVNVLCDWVVTLPQGNYTPDQDREFFQRSYDFLSARYGESNVVSAYVHMDESQPHLHFAFIPVVPDRRRGGEKVSAKECITREDLNKFHIAFQAYLDDRCGQDLYPVLNGATAGGNRAVQELQAERQIEKAQAAAQKEISAARQAAQDARKELRAVQEKAEAAEERLRAAVAVSKGIQDVRQVSPVRRTLTGKEIYRPEDLQALKSLAESAQKAAWERDAAIRAKERAFDQVYSRDALIDRLRTQVRDLQKQVDQLAPYKAFVDSFQQLRDYFQAWLINWQKQRQEKKKERPKKRGIER
jgi:hypothetical protein